MLNVLITLYLFENKALLDIFEAKGLLNTIKIKHLTKLYRVAGMKKIVCSEFKTGRRFLGSLPHKEDLIASIENFAIEASIHMATFSIIGAVSSVTMGSYDQKQQVYVTATETGPFEILTCTGNISLKDQKPMAHAHIVLCDEKGKAFGGHLFSETIIFAGEIELVELTGKQFERTYDAITGLMLWS